VIISFLLFLCVTGAVAGALYAMTKIPAPLFVVSMILLFLPVFGFSQTEALLPVIATAITSFIPVLLLQWLEDMKAQKVDATALIALSPGAAMGGVIGAQIVSFMVPIFFQLTLSFIVLVLTATVLIRLPPFKSIVIKGLFSDLNTHYLRIPMGLLIGTISIMAGGPGKSLASATLTITSGKEPYKNGTSTGIALFVSIAAMVGFSVPAKAIHYDLIDGNIGAIQLTSCMVLAISQLAFYKVCKNRGNRLDQTVLTLGLLAFLIIAVSRVWFMAL